MGGEVGEVLLFYFKCTILRVPPIDEETKHVLVENFHIQSEEHTHKKN